MSTYARTVRGTPNEPDKVVKIPCPPEWVKSYSGNLGEARVIHGYVGFLPHVHAQAGVV